MACVAPGTEQGDAQEGLEEKVPRSHADEEGPRAHSGGRQKTPGPSEGSERQPMWASDSPGSPGTLPRAAATKNQPEARGSPNNTSEPCPLNPH